MNAIYDDQHPKKVPNFFIQRECEVFQFFSTNDWAHKKSCETLPIWIDTRTFSISIDRPSLILNEL